MNYFLEFKQWVDQNAQEKNQISPSVWGAALSAWSREKNWKKVLEKALISTNIPTNSPPWVVRRWIESGGLPVIYQLSPCWNGLKTLINSWQSKLSNGQKLVEEIQELIRQHTENAEYAINSADEVSEAPNPNLKKGFYVANPRQRTIIVKGKVLYQPKDFTKINEQLNSLTLIFKPK